MIVEGLVEPRALEAVLGDHAGTEHTRFTDFLERKKAQVVNNVREVRPTTQAIGCRNELSGLLEAKAAYPL
jgi:hypothetical protein